MAYADFKNLLRGTAYDKVLSNKVFNIAKHPLYDGYQRGVASLFFNFFDKKFSEGGIIQKKVLFKLNRRITQTRY